ncbi:MMPL family transporter [Nonomuraea sp. CA-141351]|uniref:MMPL family transporter n=1 Tax=Nonomuraea sp. CA-141351 TaxID=3239996 RepID=UPI003D8C2038
MGRLVYRGRWTLLALSLVAALLLAPLALSGRAAGGAFEDPRSGSATAARWSEQWYGGQSPDVVIIYRHPAVTVYDSRYKKAVHDSLRGLPDAYVRRRATYWTTGSKEMVSKDEHSTYALVTLKGAKRESYAAIAGRLRSAKNLYVEVGGAVPMQAELDGQAAADLARVSAIAAPVLLVLLVVVFGSLVAALLPLVVGLLAVLGALALLPEVSVYSWYAVVLLGLGLAVDHSLLMLRAFREEIRGGATSEQAVARTMASAGRAVTVSGATVAASLLALLLFPQPFLRSIGLGAAVVALVAAVAALLVLPALLGVLGPRVDALRVIPDLGPVRRDAGGWHAIASSVVRRPVAYLVAVTVVLVALAALLSHVQFGNTDHRALPAASESRRVAETLDRDFPRNALSPIDVHVLADDSVYARSFMDQVERLPHVTGVEMVGESKKNGAVRLAVRHDLDPMSAEAEGLVTLIRSVAPGPDIHLVVVGGPTAARLDLRNSLSATLPWLAVVVCSVMLVLLSAALGSLVLPVRALPALVLSAGASFGVLAWAFQGGLLGFTGPVDASVAMLIVVVAFGMSVDHEVYLVSRARAEWLRTGGHAEAVAVGLRETGGVITGAALLLMAVAGTFATAGITVVRLLGVGLCVAIAVDAVLVRVLLGPASMRLLGSAGWWPLRSRERHELREDPSPAPLPLPPADRRPITAGGSERRPMLTIKGRPAVFGADTDPVPAPAEPAEVSRPGWEKVAEGRTRAVRANADGSGWTWVEVDE